jgi:peptidoglycan/xylan/chitin deacetylase (PgdA/CDA1 family)
MPTNGNKLAILTYHSLDPSGSVVSIARQDFANQMAALSERSLRGTSLIEAVRYRDRTGEWPKRVVVLTFDDGFANFYEAAMPVLTRYGFGATVFVVTGHMGGHNDWEQPPAGLGLLPMLSWQQATEVAKAGIEIGSHTRTHPDLRRCSPSEVEHEMTASRADIEQQLGLRAETFAYPYGGVNDVSCQLAAREFRAACTTELRRTNDDPLNLLARIDMYYLKSPQKFARLLDGRLDQYLTIRRWGRLARQMAPPALEHSISGI